MSKIILRQKEGWDLSITKDREERYRYNFKAKKPGYIKKYNPGEVQKLWDEESEGIELKTNFTWSEETGPLTHVLNKIPIRIFVDNNRIETASKFKKFLYVFLQEIMYSSWYEKMGIILSVRKLKNIYLESVWRGICDYLIDPKYIPPPLKEIKRVIDKIMPVGKHEWEGYYSDVPCFFMESDTAYRYRFQDIISEAKQEAFIKQGNRAGGIIRMLLWIISKKDIFLYPATREIKRLAELLIQRENDARKDNWGKLPELAAISMQISSFLRNKICEFMQEIDIEKVKLNYNDKFWCYSSKEYNYSGLSYQIRKNIIEKSYNL